MERPDKLSRDTRPQEQPKGTYPYAMNGIQDYIKGVALNEPGFGLAPAVLPYIPIGVIETDGFPVVFSTNNVNSAIGYYNTQNDTYQPIADDASLPFKFNFSTDRYITGQAQRNYIAQMVVAFTDKDKRPLYINCDAFTAVTLQELYLFPYFIPSTVVISMVTGGTLLPGAYYAAVKYIKNDGTESSWLSITSPIIISGVSGQATDKAVELQITGIDATADKVQIAIISKINGVLSALEISEPTAAVGNTTIVYTGTELTDAVALEDILTPRISYDRVQTMAQLNDSLYLMGLEGPQRLDMQQFANLIELRWTSKIIQVDPVYQPMVEGKEKSFLHREVYGFYARYSKTDGTFTNAFHIPGPVLNAGDRATSLLGIGEGMTAPVYKVQDTIGNFDAINLNGTFGKWENPLEFYPNTADYDSRAMGGLDLRGQPVTHHRFPSIAWCRQNLYSGTVGYGKDVMDMLGISVNNVIIPAQYANQINGWEIFYAKRNVGNSTVIGQGQLLFGARSNAEPEYGSSSWYSTGGNWSSEIYTKSSGSSPALLDQSIFHFHSFDMLFNKPSVTPDFISLELKQRRVDIPNTGGLVEDEAVDGNNNGPIVYELDYIQKGSPVTTAPKSIKGIKTSQYVPNHIETGKWKSMGIEGFFGGTLTVPEHLIPNGEISQQEVPTGSISAWIRPNEAVQQETVFLSNMMSNREALFVPFVGQSLVRCASSQSVQNTASFYHGDTYISDYSFHTYGYFDTRAGSYGAILGQANYFMGTKVVRRFISETAANLYTRYEDPANIYSKYYPKSSLTFNDKNNYLTNFIRTFDPNQFGYKNDSNAQDDLVVANIFNTYVDDLYRHPYRIHRTGKLSKQTKTRSWRTCLPLDYYEMQKNMGLPVHGEGMDDRLLIHMENALFLTQDKTKLESDIISVTLGSGDIFQFEPQEAQSAKLGYAGTQHDLACVRTPYGYIFIDSKQGQLFIYKGQLELVNRMLNDFFKTYLRLKDKNVFTGNGYTIGYDPTYKRLLLTVKNRLLSSGNIPPLYDDSLLPALAVGTVVNDGGRLLKYLGVNTTLFECVGTVHPLPLNFTGTIMETADIDTLVGTVAGTNLFNTFLISPGQSVPFRLDANTGKIMVSGHLDYFAKNLYIINAAATSTDGTVANFTITIHITEVNMPPMIKDGGVNLNDNTASAVNVYQMVATDREADTLTWTLVSGNTNGAFGINSATGQVFVADGSQLDQLAVPNYVLGISVVDATGSNIAAVGHLYITMVHVPRPPVEQDYTITIPDSTATGAIVFNVPPATYYAGNTSSSLVYTLVSQSTAGVFIFDPITRDIKLVDNAMLNVAVTPQYTLVLSVNDGIDSPVNFHVVINVIYDRANIQFMPSVPSCTGGTPTCPSGWALSSDGSQCTKVDIATPPDTVPGGTATPLQHYSYSQYSFWGTLIYPLGTYGTDGSPSTRPDTSLMLTSSPLYGFKPSGQPTYSGSLWGNGTSGTAQDGSTGRLNRTGVWSQANQSYLGMLGFSRQFNVPATGNYIIGVGSDDVATIMINGTAVVTQDLANINAAYNSLYGAAVSGSGDLYRYWHMYEMALDAGVNIITVSSTNTTGIGLIGAEIYKATISQLKACTVESDLVPYIIFSSAAPTFGSIANGAVSDVGQYSCASYPGYTLVYDPSTSSYYCKKIETMSPTVSGSTRTWAKVNVKGLRNGTIVSSLNNQPTPAQQFQDINVPYYAPVANHVDCGGTVHTYLSQRASSTAQKNNCTAGIGSVVGYVVPTGSYQSNIDQATADALALNDVNTNKQPYANTKGICQ